MGDQFERFGDIYKASVYGISVYVVRDPRYAQHVLRDNWQNYSKVKPSNALPYSSATA